MKDEGGTHTIPQPKANAFPILKNLYFFDSCVVEGEVLYLHGVEVKEGEDED